MLKLLIGTTLWLTLAVTPVGAAENTVPAPVRAQPLGELWIPIIQSAPAEVVSLNTSRLSAEITARVTAIPVLVGQEVAADVLLVELDCGDFQLALKRAQAGQRAALARRTLAAQQLTRAEKLARERHVAEEVIDQRRSELEAAEADVTARQVDVAEAGRNVDRCALRAPFRAAVVERHAGIGELANSGTPLITVQDLDQVEVSAQVIPSEAAVLARAEDLHLEYLGAQYPLVLQRVSPVVDRITRTHEVRLAFEHRRAPPGASGRFNWRISRSGLPASLLVRRGSDYGIFLLRGDRAAFHPLPDALEGRPVVVDLPANTLIITDGRQQLSDGDPVRPID